VARLGRKAERQLDMFVEHFERLDRPEAVRNLIVAIRRASERIDRAPEAGLPAPRPYPELARKGRHWIKEGAHWIAYTNDGGDSVISGVFHEAANIPGRV